jgi:hypothetical protein
MRLSPSSRYRPSEGFCFFYRGYLFNENDPQNLPTDPEMSPTAEGQVRGTGGLRILKQWTYIGRALTQNVDENGTSIAQSS